MLVKFVLVKWRLVKKTQKIRLFSKFCLESLALWCVSGPGFYSRVSPHRLVRVMASRLRPMSSGGLTTVVKRPLVKKNLKKKKKKKNTKTSEVYCCLVDPV